MESAVRTHKDSFKDAFSGLWWSVKTQPNFKIHILISIFSIWGCWFFQLSTVETTIIIFAVVLGLTGEMINTSIEAITDLVTDKWHLQAKIAKDVAAGMMLLIAFGAFLVALVIFTPHIIKYFSY